MGAQPERRFPNSWRKSGHSADQGNCIEISAKCLSVLVRDSQDRCGPVIAFAREQWRELLDRIRAGDQNYGGAP